MSFIETPRFPESISYGSNGGPGYNTNVIKLASGYEKRNVNWSQARYSYSAAFGVNTYDQLETLVAFFHVTQGMAYGFRYKDWFDYKSSVVGDAISDTDQTIGTGNASEVNFQLIKTYTQGSSTRIRTINKPVSGTVVISLDDVSKPTGWTVDATTGIVTFSSAPNAAVVVKAGYEFDVPCRFDTDELSTSLDDYNIGSAEVPIVEIRL